MSKNVISVDHGNKFMKVDALNKIQYPNNYFFNAGFEESRTPPSMGEFIQYKGKYYSLSSHRFSYERDKTKDDRYFILTLFAIAKELESLTLYKNPHEIQSITLVGGLPPEHFGTLKKSFQNYFLRGGNVLRFTFCEHTYNIKIEEVFLYPQGYAAAVTKMDDIKNFSRAIVIEMGGYTTEVIQLLEGRPDSSVIKSLEYGVIHLYNQLTEIINREYDLVLLETDIDAILTGKQTVIPEMIINRILECSRQFSKKLLSDIREKGIDLKSSQVIFGGGGYLLLQKFLKESLPRMPLEIPSLSANAEGYRILYEAGQRKKGMD